MRTTRRSALALGLGGAVGLGVVLGGCDAGGSVDGPGGSADAGGAGAAAADNPDVAMVAGVLADLDARLAALVAARTTYVGLAGALQGLEAMHLAHRAVLDPDGSAAATAPVAGRTARAALRRVRAGEQAHGEALVTAATAARSGALARLLASMSASVTQHLQLLPTRPGAV